MKALCRNLMLNLSRASPQFPVLSENRSLLFSCYVAYSSRSSGFEEQDAREVFRTGEQGEGYKDMESVSDVGNRVHQMTEKLRESTQKSMERTGEKLEEKKKVSTESKHNNDESILKGYSDDIGDELRSKLDKNPGGKPLDEDKGLDVNWRPIDENKS